MGENRLIRRRITLIIHNTLVAPIILVRLPLWLLAHAGELAAKVLNALPGMRRYDDWGGW